MVGEIIQDILRRVKLKNVFLGLILAAALLLRVVKLDAVPPGMFADEAIRGLDAYYLFNRGVDSHQDSWPVFFKVFGEYTPPIQTYLELFTVGLFGLNEYGVRMPAAILGVITVWLTYLIATKLFSERVGWLAALLMAITPWSIHYSRTGFEYNTYLTLFLISIYTLILSEKKSKLLLLSGLCWGLTFYTYNPAKLMVPAFWTTWLMVSKAELKLKIISTMILALVSIPMIIHIIGGDGLVRFNQVSIMKEESWPTKVLINYFHHYSPNFLFFEGDKDVPDRHFTKFVPLLLPLLPMLLLGFVVFVRKYETRKIVWIWGLLYPLGGVLVTTMSTYRSIIGLPLLIIISALGGVQVFKSKRYPLKVAGLGLACSILVSCWLSLNYYFKQYPKDSAGFWGWQYGPKQVMEYFIENANNYDDLVMSGEYNAGEIFTRFYDPDNRCQDKCKIGDFWRDPGIVNPQRRQLFSLSLGYLESSGYKDQFVIKKKVYYPDGSVAVVIGTLKTANN